MALAVDPHLRAWIDLVNNPSNDREVIADYYRRWVLFSPEKIRRLTALRPSPIRRISLVTRVFQLGKL